MGNTQPLKLLPNPSFEAINRVLAAGALTYGFLVITVITVLGSMMVYELYKLLFNANTLIGPMAGAFTGGSGSGSGSLFQQPQQPQQHQHQHQEQYQQQYQ